MNILISADSTCDLNSTLLQENHIAVTPLYVYFGQEERRDGIDCSPEEIFAYTRQTGKLCTTAAVSIGDYESFFAEMCGRYDAVIHFTISSEMSSCYQNACAAAEAYAGKVRVVDSRSVSAGIGLQVLRAAEDRDAGLSADEIYTRAMERRSRVCITFVLDTLEYMHKGGRCSTVAALGANLLRLRPCIETVDGRMQVGKKYRGTLQKVIKDLIHDHLQGRSDIRADVSLIPNSLTDPATVEMVVSELSAMQGFGRIENCPLGATVVCHCGPDTLGIVFEYT